MYLSTIIWATVAGFVYGSVGGVWTAVYLFVWFAALPTGSSFKEELQ